MLESRSSIPRVIVIALLAWPGANAPAQARAPYDGLWSVSLKVEQGSCGEHEIEVFNGQRSYRQIANELFRAGHGNSSGRPFSPSSIKAMVEA